MLHVYCSQNKEKKQKYNLHPAWKIILFSQLYQFSLVSLDPSIKTTLKQTWQGKVWYKKQKNAVKSAQIRSVFFFFSFCHHVRQTFFFLLFLTVSSRIRVRGGGEWVCESSKGGGERSRLTEGVVRCGEGFGSRCRVIGSRPPSSSRPSFLISSFPPQRPRAEL